MLSQQFINALLKAYRDYSKLPHERVVGKLIDDFGMRVGGNHDLYKVLMYDDLGREITSWRPLLSQAVMSVLDIYYAQDSGKVLQQKRPAPLSWGEQLYENASVAGSSSKESWAAEEAVSSR